MSIKKISVEQGAINAKRLLDGRKVIEVIPSLEEEVDLEKGEIKNKGFIGTATENAIDCFYVDRGPDFSNGDAKTIKIEKGVVKESCSITMLQDILPEIMEGVNFYNSYVYKKIGKTLFMPINRDGGVPNYRNWTYAESFVFSRENYQEFFDEMERDWIHICSRIQYLVKSGQYIGCGVVNQRSNVSTLELRTKGSGGSNYNHYNGVRISNKTHSLYFKEKGLKKIYKKFLKLKNANKGLSNFMQISLA